MIQALPDEGHFAIPTAFVLVTWTIYVVVAIATARTCIRGPFNLAYFALGTAAPMFAAGQTIIVWGLPEYLSILPFAIGYLGCLVAAGAILVRRVLRIEPEAILETVGLSTAGAMLIGVIADVGNETPLENSLLSVGIGFVMLLTVGLSAIGRAPSVEMRLWSVAALIAMAGELQEAANTGALLSQAHIINSLALIPVLIAAHRPDRGAFLRPTNVSTRREYGTRQMIAVFVWLAIPIAVLTVEAASGMSVRFVGNAIGAGVVVVIATLRVRLLVSLRDSSYSKEAELRHLGTDLVGTSDMTQARVRALGTLKALLPADGDAAVLGTAPGEILCSTGRPAGATEVADSTVSVEEWWRSQHGEATAVAVLPIVVAGEVVEHLAIASAERLRAETLSSFESASSLYNLALVGHQRQEQSHQRRSAQRFRGLSQDSGDVVFVMDGVTRAVSMVGPTVERLLGYTNDEFREIAGLDSVHKGDRAQAASLLDKAANPAAEVVAVDLRIQRASGLYWWFSVSARNLVDDPEIGGIVISMTDIHTRKLAELQTGRSESLYRTLIGQTSDVFVVADESLVLNYATPNIESVLGYAAPELFGTDALNLLTDRSQRKLEAFLSKHDLDLQGKSLELEATTKWGHPKAVEISFCDPDQTFELGYIVRVKDLSERRELEARFQRHVGTDALTALPMRAATYDGIAERLQELSSGEELSVLAIDASGSFGVTGAALGLEHGDALMLDMVERVNGLVRDTDLVSRIDGYEIAIVSAGASGDRVSYLWQRIQQLLNAPFTIRGSERRVKLSVGCYQTARRSESPVDVLEAAHIALGFARQERGSSMVVFRPEMRERLAERLELDEAMQSALELNEFFVAYQPLIRLDNMRVKSLEALLRWQHPGRGLVSPADFIPIAEESGMITELGRFVLRESCRTVREWNESLHDGEELAVSVNVSVRQLQEPGEVARLIQIIDESGVNPENLVIELTESILVEDPAWLRSHLAPFQRLGAQIAVDDFGTGAAGLNQLREVRFDYLKIDKSYIDRLGISEEGTQLVLGVIELGHRVGAAIVAEGIENPVQVQLLRDMSCEVGQGFFFAKPMAPERFPNWLKDGDHGAVTMGIDHHSLYRGVDDEMSPALF